MCASVIQTIGGIHEVYFTYILEKPKLLLGFLVGVVSTQFITSYLGGGTIVAPAPGSLISLIALSPGTWCLMINLLSFIVGFSVSLIISSLLHIIDKKEK